MRVRRGRDTLMCAVAIEHDALTFDGQAVERMHCRRDTISWDGGPAELASGRLDGLLDPITLHPMIHGTAFSAAGAIAVLRGMVPLDDDEARALAGRPGGGLPAWAWAHVVRIMRTASDDGGLFLWHGWDRAAVNARRIRHVLTKVREDDAS
jgi:hypothetical protein